MVDFFVCQVFLYLWGSGMLSKYDVISLSSKLSQCSLYHVYKGLGVILCFALDPGLYCISCLQIGGGYDCERDFCIFEFSSSHAYKGAGGEVWCICLFVYM